MLMQVEELKQRIKDCLSNFSNNLDLLTCSKTLLDTLGYQSEKTLNLGGVDGFIRLYISNTPHGKTEQSKKIKFIREECKNLEFIFQITDEEITKEINSSATRFDEGNSKSFMFLAADLVSDTYSRTKLAILTRTLNQCVGSTIPAIIIFRYSNKITLSIVHRRPSKRQGDDQDVLSKVTQVRDIDLDKPHRAHLEILSELSLDKAINQREVENFDSLHKEWERVLNSETLGNRFYRDLFEWFKLAKSKCQFPTDETTTPESHIIRLITRLLFIWFLKEKSLIPDEIFTEQYANKMVVDHDPNNSNYYHAVILNLFFSTLNTEIDKRICHSPQQFSSSKQDIVPDTHYIFNSLLKKSNDFAKNMEKIPFVNGGLFDSLSSEVLSEDDPRFTEVSIPGKLLLDDNYGLVSLFRRYKFTVQENTPIEIEVALDPELMGMVFENLLAAYNPETSETVRQSTGSYYTPRSVVDYMVRQTLTETLLKHIEPGEDNSWWRDRLEYLFDHSNAKADAVDFFDDGEKQSIINVISNLKTLDPSYG